MPPQIEFETSAVALRSLHRALRADRRVDSLEALSNLRQRAASSAEALTDEDRRTDPLRRRVPGTIDPTVTPCLARLAARLEA